jgi:hypothetical protein
MRLRYRLEDGRRGRSREEDEKMKKKVNTRISNEIFLVMTFCNLDGCYQHFCATCKLFNRLSRIEAGIIFVVMVINPVLGCAVLKLQDSKLNRCCTEDFSGHNTEPSEYGA